jgi:4-amino-4-deoxy-L-arabinose transferase-like glycosyltransferase
MSEPTEHVRLANRKGKIFSRESVWILLLFLIFLSLRIVHLSADPPDNLSLDSCSEYGDPGNYALNARNKALFGRWQIDGFGGLYVVPIPVLVTYGSFLAFGVGIWQMNLVPLFFSALCWLALFLLASRYFPESRLLFFILLSLNYPWGIYSRINDQVMPMTFFVILAIYFFIKAWDGPKTFFLSALFLSLSFLSKEKILYFLVIVIPLSFVLICFQRRELKDWKLNLTRIAYFLSGSAPIAGLWYFFLYLPHRNVYENLLGLNVSHMVPKSLNGAVSNWLRRPAFAFHPGNAVLTFLLFFYFLSLLFFLYKKDKNETGALLPLKIICSVWLVVGLAINSFFGYRPIRHYIEFSIPLLILSSLFLTRLPASFRLRIRLKNRGLFIFLSFLLIWVATTSYSRRIFSRETLYGRPEKVLLVTTLLAVAFSALLYLAVRFLFSAKDLTLPKTAAIGLAAVLLVLYSYQNLKTYGDWAAHATYNLQSIGRDLGRAFPQGVFCGLLVPSLSLENRNKAHTSWPNYANDEPDFLKREKVTHLVVGTFNDEPKYYENNYSEEWKRAKLLARYWLWRSWFLLYEIQNEPALPIRSPVYESETMERDVGRPFFDPQAGNRFAVFVAKGERGVIGREKVFFPAGVRLRGRLYAKLGDGGQPGSFLLLRIIRKGVVIFNKPFAGLAGDIGNEYKAFDFELSLPGSGDYEFEIQSSGGRGFAFDKIELNTES